MLAGTAHRNTQIPHAKSGLVVHPTYLVGLLDAQKRKDTAFRLWVRRPFDDPA